MNGSEVPPGVPFSRDLPAVCETIDSAAIGIDTPQGSRHGPLRGPISVERGAPDISCAAKSWHLPTVLTSRRHRSVNSATSDEFL